MTDQDRIAALLSSLVAIPSVDGRTEDKRRIAEFAAGWLRGCGVGVRMFDHPQHPSLIARVGDPSARPFLLLAHLDVVPAPEELFTMRRDGGRVSGRGVLDDKGPSALLMVLMADLAGLPHPPAVELALTTDEEIGSADGVARLVADGVFGSPRAIIAIDGGGEDAVVHAEKGVAHITLEAAGRSAHNSTPWVGDNAIEKIWRCYERIKAAFPAEGGGDDRWHHTVSIGRIQGGLFVNQVPGSARAEIDIRFVEPHDAAGAERIIRGCLEDGVTLAHCGGGEPFSTAPDDPLLRAYAGAMNEALGKPVRIVREHGATDARFFRSFGVPIWLHDPLGDGMHTDDEWMDLGSAAALLRGLRAFLENTADA